MNDRSENELDRIDIVCCTVILAAAAFVLYALAKSEFALAWRGNGVAAIATFFKIRSSRERSRRWHRAQQQNSGERANDEA
ncbi:hypothetical protein [Longimicrobium sp.]|uniref:hypothetical protein n=1 Tax=Longimicrobium sp. TaxID=2029185 RepID=UPI002C61840F|nr:hypothetical protein [Longimicrobium sp.]HSU15808.1 hypothetical protein [Longimicrobium sp.]